MGSSRTFVRASEPVALLRGQRMSELFQRAALRATGGVGVDDDGVGDDCVPGNSGNQEGVCWDHLKCDDNTSKCVRIDDDDFNEGCAESGDKCEKRADCCTFDMHCESGVCQE